jgi:hypothetical protein
MVLVVELARDRYSLDDAEKLLTALGSQPSAVRMRED